MTGAIAILTWNRCHALKTILAGIEEHELPYPVGIFEDAGYRDDTGAWLKAEFELIGARPDLEAVERKRGQNQHAFIGTDNLGVAGNTNRAIKWFMDETSADYLVICNDDLIVKGDFVLPYWEAYQKTGIGLFCFCAFTSDMYKHELFESHGVGLKRLSRMTGAAMAISRKTVEMVGYMDTRFGKFGEEHCDYTHRCRFAGLLTLNGVDENCLDVQHSTLDHNHIESSMKAGEREEAVKGAEQVYKQFSYATDGWHRPFALRPRQCVGGVSFLGIPRKNLPGYAVV